MAEGDKVEINDTDDIKQQFHSAVDRLNVIIANAEVENYKRESARDRRHYEHDKKDLIVRVIIFAWLSILTVIALINLYINLRQVI